VPLLKTGLFPRNPVEKRLNTDGGSAVPVDGDAAGDLTIPYAQVVKRNKSV
jgi:hypothetical protein